MEDILYNRHFFFLLVLQYYVLLSKCFYVLTLLLAIFFIIILPLTFFTLLCCSFTADSLCLDRAEACHSCYMHIVLYIDNMYFISSGVTRSLQCSPGGYLTFVAQGKGWDKRIIITAAECSWKSLPFSPHIIVPYQFIYCYYHL